MADEEQEVRVVAAGTGGRHGGPSIGVVLAIIAALVFGGLVGRVSAPDDDSVSAPPSADGGTATAVGPTTVRAGVPVGYERSEQGAAAALLNYSGVLARLLLEEPDTRQAALEVLSTDDFAERTAGQLERARRAAEKGPLGAALRGEGTAVFRGGPLGFRVTRYRDDEAVVETWAFGVVAATADLDPRMTFQTSTSTLAWQDGDWKLATTESRPGPAPSVDSDQQVSGRAFVDSVGQLKELRYAP